MIHYQWIEDPGCFYRVIDDNGKKYVETLVGNRWRRPRRMPENEWQLHFAEKARIWQEGR